MEKVFFKKKKKKVRALVGFTPKTAIFTHLFHYQQLN